MFRTTLLLLALLSVTPLQAASPSIESVAPGIGRRGSEFELKLVGAGFADTEEVLLYREGVTCLKVTADSENELTLRLAAATDCRLGSYPFRIRTRKGITELRTFRITPLAVVASVEPNNSPETAQVCDRNVTVAGAVESDDYDCYRIGLKKGERLSAEVEAVRLGGSLLDLKLAVFGPDGTLLAEVDDAPLFRQDPFVTLVAPQDGEYVVRVCETNLEGDANSLYALHLGTFPRPAIVYPAGGPAGQAVEVRFLGDASDEFTQRVDLPPAANAPFDLFPTRDGLSSPTPQPFRVSSFPNVLEQEPNYVPAKAGRAVELPAAFNGIVQQAGDVDCQRFRAEAGQVWRFELFGDRIGSPLDAVMSLTDVSGEILARSDDSASHDGQIEFLVPTDGEYVLQVTDKREGGGPHFVYRVEASEPRPQLTAFMPRPDRRSQERQSVSVPRGNRVLAYLAVQRDGVASDVQLSASGLPSGVSMLGGQIPADRFWMPVILEAGAAAPIGGSLADIQAAGDADGRPVTGGFRQVVDLVAGPADALYHSSEVDRLVVAVTEEVPFKLNLVPPTIPLPQDGTLALRVVLERAPGFDAPVDVTFPLLPPWVDGPARLTIPGNESSGEYVMRAWADAEARSWTICAEGRPGAATDPVQNEATAGSPMSGRRGRSRSSTSRDVRVASELVELSIGQPLITAEPASVAGEQGRTVKLVYLLAASGRRPDRLTATLEGLPNRISAEAVAIEGDAARVEFAVRLEPSAPLGEFTGLVCRLSGELNGQDVSYCVGRGTMLTVVPPGELVVDEQGRPASKLDALRRKQQSPGAKVPDDAAN